MPLLIRLTGSFLLTVCILSQAWADDSPVTAAPSADMPPTSDPDAGPEPSPQEKKGGALMMRC